MSWTNELAKEISGRVLNDVGALEGVATDFGSIIVRRPQAVVRPESAEDVSRVVKFAARHSLSVATRGAGHSQAGQSLSDHIVLDMTSLDKIKDFRENSVTVQGGVSWGTLLNHALRRGLSPPVLTNNLNVTVGGTLSMGGLGVTS